MISVLAGLTLLFLTGHAVARLLRVRVSWDPISSAAVKLGLGLSVWPLLLLWTSTAGLHLGKVSTRLVLLLFALVAAGDALHRGRRLAGRVRFRSRLRGFWPFLVIAAAAAWTRVWHIRDLVVPAWVDSVHHMMIVRLIVEHGALPSSYAPYIPSSDFSYHWGYHALMGAVIWLTGRSDPFQIAQAMLDFGQLLNVLTIFPMYAAGRAMFRSRRAGFWAAALATLVSFFPAYYVSWGRYTQLCGTLLLPLVPLAASRIRRPAPGSIVGAAILAAGLGLIHIRLAFFALTALGVLAAYRILRCTVVQRLAAWGVFVLLTFVLIAPWLWKLAANPYVHRILSPPAATALDWDTPTVVHAELAWAPRNRELLVLGTGGIAGLVLWHQLDTSWRVLSIGLWLTSMALTEIAHRRRRSLRTLWMGIGGLAAWAAVTAVLLNLQILGLPRLRIASNTSAVITLFIPLCLGLAGFISAMTGALLVRRRRVEVATNLAIATVAAVGVFTFRHVVNPQTILASEADIRAMRWIRAHTPPESVFMVRTRQWLRRSRMGTDGGAWIQLLTNRRSILPPGLYPWVAADGAVATTESVLKGFEGAASMDNESLRELLDGAGVTHVYFGDRDQGVGPSALSGRPYSRLVYEDGRVHIFEIEHTAPGAGRRALR